MMSVNNDVLSEVGFTSETIGVWAGWLVNGPVVVWWVLNWVLELDEGGSVESSSGVGSGISGHVSGGVGGNIGGNVGSSVG